MYIGRFAPSPTGALHLGSLFAAVASYLDARHCGGRWLLRMEDLDAPRIVPGSADAILRTLERFALHWDGEILYQSRQKDRYAAALARLGASGLTFECSCSRKELAEQDLEFYPGTCRERTSHAGPTATRFHIEDSRTVRFEDRVQGEIRSALARLGDPIIRRRDGLPAYQLAVVLDDALQGVTDVVRGADLLHSTAWQIELQQALGLSPVRYAHVPLLVEPDGRKLAKSSRSIGLEPERAAAQLASVLVLLGLPPPPGLANGSPSALLGWAVPRWSLAGIHGRATLPAPGPLEA
jgi:glutamyl-Q tRNA(Asp) synthetase